MPPFSQFRLSVVKPSLKYLHQPIKTKQIIIGSQSELKKKGGGKASKLTEEQENASDQVVFVWSFSSDCLRRWRNFSWPATKKSESKLTDAIPDYFIEYISIECRKSKIKAITITN